MGKGAVVAKFHARIYVQAGLGNLTLNQPGLWQSCRNVDVLGSGATGDGEVDLVRALGALQHPRMSSACGLFHDGKVGREHLLWSVA